jgi:hypothetical protein
MELAKNGFVSWRPRCRKGARGGPLAALQFSNDGDQQ